MEKLALPNPTELAFAGEWVKLPRSRNGIIQKLRMREVAEFGNFQLDLTYLLKVFAPLYSATSNGKSTNATQVVCGKTGREFGPNWVSFQAWLPALKCCCMWFLHVKGGCLQQTKHHHLEIKPQTTNSKWMNETVYFQPFPYVKIWKTSSNC